MPPFTPYIVYIKWQQENCMWFMKINILNKARSNKKRKKFTKKPTHTQAKQKQANIVIAMNMWLLLSFSHVYELMYTECIAVFQHFNEVPGANVSYMYKCCHIVLAESPNYAHEQNRCRKIPFKLLLRAYLFCLRMRCSMQQQAPSILFNLCGSFEIHN